MVENWQLVSTSIAYIGVLFVIASLGERMRHRLSALQQSWVYALTLGVYCTSWGFIGTAGQAANHSFSYFSVYIGPILLFVFGWSFIQRIIRVSLSLNITSIADLLASRFGKSKHLAVLVTLVALIGTLPYIALQLKAIVYSYQMLRQESYLPFWLLTLIVSLILTMFTVIFGIRNIDVTERHPGLMVAIAFESLVKVIAFLMVGMLVCYVIYDSPATLWSAAKPTIDMNYQLSGSNMFNLLGLLVIAISAFLCLPRQFQVMVVELKEQRSSNISRWWFPLYLVIFTLFAGPMGLAGSMLYGESMASDAYVLFLPSFHGQSWLSLLVFIGVVSAASSMVFISTIALSTMLSNELVFPAVFRRSTIPQTSFNEFQVKLLAIRKWLVLAVILLSYGMILLAPPDKLSSLGEIAFGAIAQLGPALFAAFLWRRANLRGVIVGLAAGFSIWFFANLLPQLGLYSHPFTNAVVSPTTLATLLGLGINVIAMWTVSLNSRPNLVEQMQIEHFFERDALSDFTVSKQRKINPQELELLVSRFLGKERTKETFENFHQRHPASENTTQAYNEALIFHTENALVSVMGSASARLVISCILDGRDIALDEVAQLVEQTSSERLLFSQSVLQSAIENAREGISVIDSSLNLVAWNERYLALFNYPEELIYIGCPVSELLRFNLGKRFPATAELDHEIEKRIAFLRAGSRHSIEREQPDGKVFHIEGNPIPGGGFVMIFSDITVYRHSENTLKEINLNLEERVHERTCKLEEANRKLVAAQRNAEQAHLRKSQYLKACSHDLIQPLAAAKMFTNVLANASNLTETQNKQIASIDSALQAANDLLVDLNEVARIESGNIQTDIQPVSIQDVFASLRNEFIPMARQHNVDLRWVSSSLFVYSDPKMLRRILQNLIGNALRYAQSGKVLVGCRRLGSHLKLQVIDNGPGIPLEQQQIIFEQFVQLDQPSSRQTSAGLGLGLNIAKGLSTLLKHEMTLQSRINQGCCFSLTVPLCQQHLNPPQPSYPKLSMKNIRVLCIDNERSVLDGLHAVLKSWHCRVLTAQESTEALQLAERYTDEIDIVLADYQLDDGDSGLELIEQLRQVASRPLPAILISATTDTDAIQQAYQQGVTYLPKMAKPDELKTKMAELLTIQLQENYLESAVNSSGLNCN